MVDIEKRALWAVLDRRGVLGRYGPPDSEVVVGFWLCERDMMERVWGD